MFLPLYVLSSEVLVLKSRHTISVKWSRYQDTGPTDPSLVCTVKSRHEITFGSIILNFARKR